MENSNLKAANSGTATKEHICWSKCISWSSIVAGVFVALGLDFLLNFLGISIGLITFKSNAETGLLLAFGEYVAMAIGVIVILFVSGWIAGYTSQRDCDNPAIGALLGFLTWSMALVAGILLAASINGFALTSYATLLSSQTVPTTATTETQSSIASSISNVSKNNSNENEDSAALDTQSVCSPAGNCEAGKSDNVLSISLFMAFLLFLLGALSSILGGYYGIKKKGRFLNSESREHP